MDLIREAQAYEKKTGSDDVESVIGTSMSEGDLEKLLAWPFTNLCTDGELDGRHPRGFGTYPRVLGRYVRERKVVSLEEGVRRMTSLAARQRGAGRPGSHPARGICRPRPVRPRDRDRSRHHARAPGPFRGHRAGLGERRPRV